MTRRTPVRPAPCWADADDVRFMLEDCETWAVVGLSGDPSRTAYEIARYLQQRGKRIVPIHPSAPVVLGQQGYATLADVPFAVDVVDVFRRSEAAGEFADQAVAVGAKAVWFQLGVVDVDAFDRTVRPAYGWSWTPARPSSGRGSRAAPDGLRLPRDPARRHRRHPARARRRGPLPLARGPRLRGDRRLGHRPERGEPRLPRRAAGASVVPPGAPRHRADAARGHPRPDRRPLPGQPQRRHPAAGPVVRRRQPRGRCAAAAGCSSTPTSSPRTARRPWPGTTSAWTAACSPTRSATAAATGRRCASRTSPPARTSTTCSPR